MSTTTLSGKTRFVVAAAAVAMVGALVLGGAAAPAHAATPQLKGSATTAKKYSKPVKSGKTVGAAKAKAKALKGVKVTVSGATGKIKVKTVKSGGKIQAVSMKLSGAVAKKYDVTYRVYVPTYGWMGWASKNNKAGAKVKGKYVTAYQVKLVAKKKAKTSAAAYTANANFFKLTGDATADAQIVTLAKGKNLEGAFKAFIGKMSYSQTGRAGLAKGNYPVARLKTEGKDAFKKFKGDCYTYTAGVYYLATYLGYSAKAVSGEIKNALGVWNPNSWCEIAINGKATIWNGNLQYHADGKFTGKMNISELKTDAEGNLVIEDGKYVRTGTTVSVTPKLYNFTHDQVNDYFATIESGVYTGYDYR